MPPNQQHLSTEVPSIPLYHAPMQDPHPSDFVQMSDEYSFYLSLFHHLPDTYDTTQARSQFWTCRQ